ncbi:MAG: hypothetical protein IPL61_12565 [Myxococcales bacterium]|nr:hypothetical protein [Myxococcales bacterium]
MSTATTIPTLKASHLFTAHARDVVRAHVRELGGHAGRVAARVRTTVGQVAGQARAYAGRLGAVAERYIGAKVAQRVRPPILAALVLAGAALAVAIVAVVVRRK